MSVVLFSAPPGVYDTSEEYGKELVCYGAGYKLKHFKVNGELLVFPDNKRKNVTKIDERNLGSTRWLNLFKS